MLTLRVAAIPSAATIVPAPAALRAQAKLLADMRTSLKCSSPLENLATLTLGSSGLSALSADSTAAPVSLVQFPVPGVSKDVLVGPKGACAGCVLASVPLPITPYLCFSVLAPFAPVPPPS